MKFSDRVHKLDRNLLISGQLFFREQGPAMELDMTYRQIFGVSGIIAIPNDSFIKPEHQYSLAGLETKSEGGIIIGIDPETAIDLEEKARGMNIGQLLTRPIWRI